MLPVALEISTSIVHADSISSPQLSKLALNIDVAFEKASEGD